VSNNSSDWTQAWTNTVKVADSSWVQLQYDISAVADGQPTVYIRITMGATDSSYRYCGWNIDDLQIWATRGADPTCDDGAFCNGVVICDNYGECHSGISPCTGFDCDEASDVCIDCYQDGDCDDGPFCNGQESFVGNVCQAGSDPCPGQSCDEESDIRVQGPTVLQAGVSQTVSVAQEEWAYYQISSAATNTELQVE
jgi:hypothetical protein